MQVNTKAWYAALDKVGIEDFRWHDLRHTWASWPVQNGTPLFALQELGGWKSAEMVRRYAHRAADHLAHMRSVSDHYHSLRNAMARFGHSRKKNSKGLPRASP